MTISELIKLTQSRIDYLSGLLSEFTRLGDVDSMTKIQDTINESKITLDKLKSLE